MAKIGLIDVDGHNFPNLATMKISAWHKGQGDDVEWYDGLSHYDKVYVSKVFSFTPDWIEHINAGEVVRGGTGYALHGPGGIDFVKEEDKPLPDYIEHIMPDYSLYGIKDTAYGFLTRGCPRGCEFCIVGKKEGLCSRKVADLSEFWNGQKKLVLCDPNLLACKDRMGLLEQIARSKAKVEFNQGCDIRFITKNVVDAMNECNIINIHFAWDRYEDKEIVLPKFELFSSLYKKNKFPIAQVYVLVNFNTTIDQDLERIYTLRDLKYLPYVMIYDKENCNLEYRHLQRWCNNRRIFAKCPRFEDYKTNMKEERTLMIEF
jgi:hypothetical protein